MEVPNNFETLLDFFFSKEEEDTRNIASELLKGKVGEVGEADKDPEFISKIKEAITKVENKAEKVLIFTTALDNVGRVDSNNFKEVQSFLMENESYIRFIFFVNRAANISYDRSDVDKIIKEGKDKIREKAELMFNDLVF